MKEQAGKDGDAAPKDPETAEEESKGPPQLATFSEVFSFAESSSTKACIAGSLVFALISGSCFPAMAFYFASAFEVLSADTANADFRDTLREISITFMVLGSIMLVGMTAQSTLIETAAGQMTRNLQTQWFEALLRQDLAYYDIKDVSGEASIISSINASKYRRGIGKKLADAVQYFVTFCGGMGYAFYASWRVSLAVMAIAPLMSVSAWFVVKMNSSQTARANQTYSRAGSIVYTTVSNLRTILSLNAVEYMIDQYRKATDEACRGATSQVGWVGLANGCQMASFALSYIIVTLFGAFLLYDNLRDTGCDPSGTVDSNLTCDPAAVDIFGSLLGITFAASVLPQVSVALEAFVGARSACYPAIEVLNREVGVASDAEGSKLPTYEIDSSSPDGKKPESIQGAIEFDNVYFQYPARIGVDVFSGFSLSLEPGKTVALVGGSGCGKSTATALLERFYDPQEGSVRLDGIDLRDLNIKWLRQHIGLVGQEPKLFAMSIRDNIAAGHDVSQSDIEEAARMANAHDFISSFPNGYDTQVGDLGGQLSGGQKQRIAIARVLVKKPKVLILDEATSALDSESESIVQQALDNLMTLKSMTTLVIAHRLSTVKKADMIAVVEGGKIIESGNHNDLVDAKGRYFELVSAQHLTADHGRESAVRSSETGINDSIRGSRHSVASSEHRSEGGAPLVRFRDVHFSFPSRPDVSIFRGLNLSVYEGETLAIVGPSGMGKSTIIQLIECFYHPDDGSVEFNGTNLKDLNVRWLRDQLGLVSQEPILFDTSIAENIRYGLPDASQEQIEDAARAANAHDFIMSFPKGYETRIGQGSNLVSGGQKQRIAIARALLKRPLLLLLDEATSALDSKSEQIVQSAIDDLIFGKQQTCVIVAHRLSTIRNADRIAVVDRGLVREIGTHDDLMAKGGRYARLYAMQDLNGDIDQVDLGSDADDAKESMKKSKKKGEDDQDDASVATEIEIDKDMEKSNSRRARLLAQDDTFYFLVGGVGGLLAGLIFPSWGFVFAYMIEMLYTPVQPCPPVLEGFLDCADYHESIADDMQDESLLIFYSYIGTMVSTLAGFTLLFWGFGNASERINKRVRDAAFSSLVRQEVAWFDLHSTGSVTSSVLVGLIISFVYMWPEALITLAILPFMAFGAEQEMKMYMGEDEGAGADLSEGSPGQVVIEALSNIRTIASLTLEGDRISAYEKALVAAEPHPVRTNLIKGSGGGLGQFVQMWGMALMFFFGGWILENYPETFGFRDFMISMFALLFSLYGLAVAAQGAVDRGKANRAAHRIFELIDRQSLIDPLSEEGKKEV